MAGSEAIQVITLADSQYAMPLAVMVRSLLENHSAKRALTVKILDGGLSEEDRDRLQRSWQGASRGRAEWEFIQPSLGDAQALPVWGRVPALTYARLTLNDYYRDGEPRTVVLDSDVLVLADVTRLYDADLRGAVLGACIDPYIPNVSAIDGLRSWRELGLAPDAPYFNAGVMVVDLERFKDLDTAESALQYIRRFRLRQYDQDGLNAAAAGRWRPLDPRWHVHPRARNSFGTFPPDDPWIVHFSGRLKPWLYSGSADADRLFFEYLGRTEWRGFRPKRNFASLAYQLYDSPLRRMLYPLESRVLSWKRRYDSRSATR